MISDKRAEQHATLCNLFEAIWLKRKDKDYYAVDTNNLPSLTSLEARELANFVFEVLEVDYDD